jgi:polysaccharide pyruvyl transferase WcaK-like protein
MQSSHQKIAVLHHLGGGNLGDEASLQAVIQNIQRRWPDAEVTALTMNPAETTRRYGVPALPIRSHTWGKGYDSSAGSEVRKKGLARWLSSTRNPLVRIPRSLLREAAFFLHAWGTIRQFDQLVISGGGQLTGRSGPWGFPFGIFIWMTLARLARRKRVILSIGAGPLNPPLVAFFSVRSLYAANYVSFRDARSEALARAHGFKGRSVVLPDNAYVLEFPAVKTPQPASNPIVGFSPMPYPFCDPQEVPSGHQQIYEDTIGKFAEFANSVVRRSCSVALFCNDVGVDPKALDDLRITLRDRYQIVLPPYQPDSTLHELLTRTAALDYVVTCRFHGVVLAHMLNKPVLAVAHHPKVTTIMAELGLSQYWRRSMTCSSRRSAGKPLFPRTRLSRSVRRLSCPAAAVADVTLR